ncbi:hypothetical protein [Modestobacter sp. URMC 112]
MNDIALLQEAGPQAPPLSDRVLRDARALLDAEIADASAAPAGRVVALRRPRVGLLGGVAAAAAACVAAVALWPSTGTAPAGSPATSVTLVAFEMPAFPLSLSEVPDGLSPEPGIEGSDEGLMLYHRGADPDGSDILRITVRDEPDIGVWEWDAEDVTVDGRDGEYVSETPEGSPYGTEYLEWERSPDQWVTVSGDGRFAEQDELVAAAESLVDRPQVLPLRLSLAPAGWSLAFFKESGRIVTLANDAYPEQTLSVHLPGDAVPPAELPRMLEAVTGPVQETSVNGLPAQLVPTGNGWYLQAQFTDGTTFVVQAPAAFTAEQVLEVAGQVVHTP